MTDRSPPRPNDTPPRLAIDGGPPAVTIPPLAWPPDDPAILEALKQAWHDGDWGRYHGQRCDRLREALAEWHVVRHAHLCSSGTHAVELALRALGVESGDGVVLAGYDFPGNFRAIEAIGARPVLVDIDAEHLSIDVDVLEAHAEAAEEKRVRAVIVSHLHGGLADMPRLMELAGRRGWGVIEDACQAHGARLAGRPAGAWGEVGVLSFGGSKLLTAGRGGALLTSDDTVAQRLKIITGRGNDISPLSELQAAVLLPQLATLAERHAQREENAKNLIQRVMATRRLRPVALRHDSSHAFYKLAWRVDSDNGVRDVVGKFVPTLAAEGVDVGRGFRGFVRRAGRRCERIGELANSTQAAETTALLHHPALLNKTHVDQIAAAIDKVCQRDG